MSRSRAVVVFYLSDERHYLSVPFTVTWIPPIGKIVANILEKSDFIPRFVVPRYY